MHIVMATSLPSKQQVAILRSAFNRAAKELKDAEELAHPAPGDGPYLWRQFRKAKAAIPRLKDEVSRKQMDLVQAERELEQYMKDAEQHEHFHEHRVQE